MTSLKIMALWISSLGYLLFFCARLRVHVLAAPFVVACSVILMLYFAGLSGFLLIGAYLVLLLGLILGLLTIVIEPKEILRSLNFYPSYFLLFIPFVLFYLAIPKDFMFLIWDELSFWAKSQRIIFNTNQLIDADTAISFKNYPPGQQLFQYYVTLFTQWSEKNVLYAQIALTLSAILAAVGSQIRRPLWVIATYFTALTFIYFIHADYISIYSDTLLAVFFAATICLALSIKKTWRDYFVLALCLSTFLLIKEVALIFVAIVVAVFFVHEYFQQKATDDGKVANISGRKYVAISVSLLSPCLIFISWRWHVQKIQALPLDASGVGLQSLLNGQMSGRFWVTIHGFGSQLVKSDYLQNSVIATSVGSSLLDIVLACAALSGIITLVCVKGKRVASSVVLAVLFLGFVGYLGFLLWTYLFYFTEYEGVRLASFDRYTGTYILAWMLVLYVLLVARLSERKLKWLLIVPVALLCMSYGLVPHKLYKDIVSIESSQQDRLKREKAEALALIVKKYIKTGERTYFIAQNTNGYEKHMFDYAMAPYPPNECWSIGGKYSNEDVWTCDQELIQLLKPYSYLVLYKADEQFWGKYGDYFPPAERGIESGVFKITKDHHDTINFFAVQ